MEEPKQKDWWELEQYKILVAQAHYDGQHRSWTVGWFLTAHTVFLGFLLQGALRDQMPGHQSIMFWASLAGILLCVPWSSTLVRLSAYYKFRIEQAKAVEIGGWDCFGGKAAKFASNQSVMVNGTCHQMPIIARIPEVCSVWLMIGIFVGLYLYLGGWVSFLWR